MVSGNAYMPSGLIVYLTITTLLRATANAKATRDADALVFGPTVTIRWLLVILIIGFACAALYVSLTSPPTMIGTVIFGLISIAGTLAFPSNILVKARGVTEIKWWGTKTEIFWRDASRIEYHKGPFTTVVYAKDGRRVVHSGWNRDTSGFLADCKERTGLAVEESEL